MKILSFNINNDYRFIPEKAQVVIDLMRDYNIDIVGLQEVTRALYNELESKLLDGYFMSSPSSSTFFNVIISKFSDNFIQTRFENTSMDRGYIIHETPTVCLINTHLESVAINQVIREKQCNEIKKKIEKDTIVFGDLNFCNAGETFDGLHYLMPKTEDVFSYDSLLNREAIPPFRSNLDRFYSNNEKVYEIRILKDVLLSDHFPLLLTI